MTTYSRQEAPDAPVLIISSLAEPCTSRIEAELLRLGVAVLVVPFEEAILGFKWNVSFDSSSKSDFWLGKTNASLNSHFRSVWFRRWGYPVYPSGYTAKDVAFAYGEITAVLCGLPHLKEIPWINPIEQERKAANKLLQLRTAQELGIRIPKTLITNDEAAVLRFREETGKVIFKPVSGSSLHTYSRPQRILAKVCQKYPDLPVEEETEADDYLIFTQELTDEHMASLHSIKWSPAIFQQKVEKEYELRITVIGNEIFACRIDSQCDHRTSVDFRRMNTVGLVPHTIIRLCSRLEQFILKMMRCLGLTFGCFDFIVEKNTGEYFFLEVNPSGQWLWIEDVTGAPISAALARQLAFPGPQCKLPSY